MPPRERGRYQGYMGGVFAIASVIGPLIGGFLTQHASWRWVFYVNIPVGAVALVVIAIVLHDDPSERKAHRIDYEGAAALAVGAGMLTLGLTWGGAQYPWLSWHVIGAALIGIAGVIAFIWIERRAVEPLMPLRLFRNDVFRSSVTMGFLVGAALFGTIIYVSLYLQVVHGTTPTVAGLKLLPLMGGLLAASIWGGRRISKIGRYRAFPIAGTALISVGLFLLSRVGVSTGYWFSRLYMSCSASDLVSSCRCSFSRCRTRFPDPRWASATASARPSSARSAARSESRSSARSSPTASRTGFPESYLRART